MARTGHVYMNSNYAGLIEETDEGTYRFTYDASYLKSPQAAPISLTLRLQEEPYISNTIFPFFDGLIPEGWLLNLTVKNWKLARNDRMGILLEACEDCIGAVSIRRSPNE